MRKILSYLFAALCCAGTALAEDTQAVKPTENFRVIYYEFPDHFTTNLRDSNRLVQATIAIDSQYEGVVIYRVIKHRLAIANQIVMLLSNLSEADVRSPAAKARLQDSIRDAVNAVLDSKYHFGGIDHVLITSMVVQ
jgi:flagellar FliL protein